MASLVGAVIMARAFLANGQSLAIADAPGAPDSERYGLLVITDDGPAEAFFDNLEIRGLE